MAEPTRTPNRDRLLLSNSTVAIALAAPVVVTLHELAHAVAGLALGSAVVVTSNSVSYTPELPPAGQVTTAAAGPLFSLLLGVLVFLASRRVGRGFGRLFLLWAGVASMQNFAGYLLIAPIARAGDTGKILALLDAPTAAYVVSFLAGVGLSLLNARLFAGQVTRYGRDRHELQRLVLLPWAIGTGITVVLTVVDVSIGGLSAADVPVVIAGAVAVVIFAPTSTLWLGRLHPPYTELALRPPVVPLVLAVLASVLVAAVLGPGLPLG